MYLFPLTMSLMNISPPQQTLQHTFAFKNWYYKLRNYFGVALTNTYAILTLPLQNWYYVKTAFANISQPGISQAPFNVARLL